MLKFEIFEISLLKRPDRDRLQKYAEMVENKGKDNNDDKELDKIRAQQEQQQQQLLLQQQQMMQQQQQQEEERLLREEQEQQEQARRQQLEEQVNERL